MPRQEQAGHIETITGKECFVFLEPVGPGTAAKAKHLGFSVPTSAAYSTNGLL